MCSIKELLSQYKIYKMWLKTYSNMDKKSSSLNVTYTTYSNYVNSVENIFNSMDEEFSNILKSYYVDNVKREELHYSNSTFYSKLNKASKEFSKYIDILELLSK